MLKSLFHWKVLVNILLAIAVFVGALWLTMRWLEVHTNHGKEIPVPNVMNKSVQDAIKILDDLALTYEVDSFNFDPKFKPFQVLQIYPSAGSRVKDGRTIVLKVNPRTYAQVSVPDIIDRYKGLAFRQLEQVGLKMGDTLYEPSIQRDAVLRMMYNGATLKPGTLLPRFTTIDLVIGAGPRRNITVPSLIGLTVQEAKLIIKQNLFEVGLVDFEDGGGDESDIIYYQDPAPYDVRDQGMQIDIWGSKKTPAEMGGKISELNAIYRIQMDYSMPDRMPDPNDAPVYQPAVPRGSESGVPETPRPPAPKVDASGTAPKQTDTKQTAPKSSDTKVKSTATPVKTKTTPTPTTSKGNTTKTEEKPKVRKVVVE